MSIYTDLIIPQTIAGYCEQRAKVVAMMADYYRMSKLTDDTMRESVRYGLPSEAMPHLREEDAIKQVDRQFWRTAFEQTGFMQLLDAQSRNQFEESNRRNPPVFNMDNVRSTFLDLMMNAEQMFSDGIVNVFRRLSGNYMSNDVFKVGEKIVMSGMIEARWSSGKSLRFGRGEDEINDIDRVFKTLDGKRHQPRELSCEMNKAFAENADYSGEYFSAKAFKNGNLHLKIKRADLLERVNMMIAKHYGGDALGKGRG